MNLVVELVEWWQALPADFAFLVVLPFVVGAAGLAAEALRARPAKPAIPAGDARARARANLARR